MVQNFVAHQLASFFSKELKTEISIGSIEITGFFNVSLENVTIKDLHKNLLLDSKKMTINVSDINTKNQFISLGNILMDNTTINLRKYKSEKEMNLQFLVNYFSSKDTVSTGNSWGFSCFAFSIRNAHFVYQDLNKEFTDKGIDFNNLDFKSLNVDVSRIEMVGDSTYANIQNFSFCDRSGFIVKKLSADLMIGPKRILAKRLSMKTDNTDIAMHLKLDYNDYSDFENLFEKVKLYAILKPSHLALNDLAFFSPDLIGLTDIVNISGEIKGNIANLKGKNFRLLYGSNTHFSGNFTFTGLPNIEETYIKFTVKNFSTTKQDIEAFNIPGTKNKNHILVPDEIARLGNIRFNGSFNGFVNDFVAAGNFYTDLGNFSTDLSLRNKNHIISYNGKVATSVFDLGTFMSDKELFGKVSMDADISGSGLDSRTANATLKGNISAIEFKKYNYKDIDISGTVARKKFKGQLNVRDENLDMDFAGTIDYSDSLPVFDFTSDIRKAAIANLHLVERDSIPTVSSSLKFKFTGDKIDNIQGNLECVNTRYQEGSKDYKIQKIDISNTSNYQGFKTLDFRSDFADIYVSGQFMFKDLNRSLKVFLNEYLPAFGYKKDEKMTKIPEENFSYKIDLKNTEQLTQLFMADLKIADKTNFSGFYNSNSSALVLMGKSSSIQYKKTKVKNFTVKGKTENNVIKFNASCDRLFVSDSTWLDSVNINTSSQNDSVLFGLYWNNKAEKFRNSGDIIGFVSFVNKPKIDIRLLKSEVVINDSVWAFGNMNLIQIDSNQVALYNVNLHCNNQKLSVSGFISGNPKDILTVQFNEFDVSNIDFLTDARNFDMDGIINGSLRLSDLYATPNFSSDLNIRNFGFNHDRIGDVVISTYWDDFVNGIKLNANVLYKGNVGITTPMIAAGYFYPDREKNNFNIDVKLEYLKLKFLTHYFTAFTSDFSGITWGNLKIQGATNEPELSGSIKLAVKHLKIDYLNTVYSFTTDVEIKKNSFAFNHLVLYDVYGDSAIVNGTVNHDQLADFTYNFDIQTKKFLFLNTGPADNSLYYGKAMMSGLFNIYGNEQNTFMDINAKTLKNTQFFVPLSNTSELSENNFITFTDRINTKIVQSNTTDLSGIQMDFNLEVTPDADVQIIFDSKIGDVIKAKGNANFQFQISTNGDFKMYGDYIIEDGDYLFTLQNVINKRFKVQQGGVIQWNGDPYVASVNLNAIYKCKAPLYDLLMDSTAIYKKRIPVDCILGMTDNLMNPTLTFDIDLPNSDENTKLLVKRAINTEQDMNRQVFSLLVLNRFVPPNTGTANLSSGVGSTSSELLSNQLSNWLSQISKQFDIGVKYRPGDEISSNELEVALSTQLFNDRVSIDGNLGMAGNNAATPTNQSSSNFVGDVNVEVKLTDDGKFRIKAYNHSNTNDILNNNSPYTQGMGIFYRKEFDDMRGLLHGSKASKKKKTNK